MERKKGECEVKAAVILSDPAFIEFKDNHEIGEGTMIGYVNALQRYVELHGLSLSELVEEALKEEKERVAKKDRNILKRMRAFRKYLKSLDLSEKTIKRMLAGVKSFYEFGHQIEIPKLGKDQAVQGRVKEENKEIPSREDIIKALKMCDKREKAIVLGLSSSGLDRQDFTTLTIKQFEEGFDSETGITTLEMRRGKTGNDFITFFSSEATEAIQDYLEWRNRPEPKTSHKDISISWKKHRVYTDSDYLFCDKFISDEFLETHDEEIRKIDGKALSSIFRYLASRAGLSREKNVWNSFRAHKLRSWFNTQLMNDGCPKEVYEMFMGHKGQLGSSGGTYINGKKGELKNIYLKHMPSLALTSPIITKIIDSNAYKTLQNQLDEKTEEMVKLEEMIKTRDSEIIGGDKEKFIQMANMFGEMLGIDKKKISEMMEKAGF